MSSLLWVVLAILFWPVYLLFASAFEEKRHHKQKLEILQRKIKEKANADKTE